LQGRGILRIEAIVISLVAIIGCAFLIEIIIGNPHWPEVMRGFIPHADIYKDMQAWVVAIGILGATVMPHNLYLHSSAVSTRKIVAGQEAKADAIRLLTWDTLLTLGIAFFVNAGILIMAGSVFHFMGHTQVTRIDDAYRLLTPVLGGGAAVLFGIALFASGQSSTLTGTIAGQVVLQGFLNLRIPCWQQRLFTRLCAVIPAWLGIMLLGNNALEKMLVTSQVVLSMQLPFAMVPLILFNANSQIMGLWRMNRFVSFICWCICFGIIAANIFLIYQTLFTS
jgi:manganese transport protein